MPGAPSGIERLAVGDPVPAIQLAGADGGRVDLNRGRYAGSAVVLWLTEAAPRRVRQKAVERRLGDFEALEARLVGVVGARPEPGEAAGATRLHDPERRLAAAFGLEGGGFVVLDAGRRLAGRFAGEDLEGALACCRALWAASPEAAPAQQAPVLIVPGVLPDELCRRVIDYWGEGEKLESLVALGRDRAARADPGFKQRQDVMLADASPLTAEVKRLIVARVVPELFKAFFFQTANMEGIRIGCYDAAQAGHFGRHRDNDSAATVHRRFAMSLNLNRGEYAGGEIRFPEYGRMRYSPPTGGTVLFSCTLVHEALAVTRGRRFGLFTFFTDRAGLRQREEMQAR